MLNTQACCLQCLHPGNSLAAEVSAAVPERGERGSSDAPEYSPPEERATSWDPAAQMQTAQQHSQVQETWLLAHI